MAVLFGPQGSGNHLFGKIFSTHPDVHGWKAALKSDGYFIPHYNEPFNYYWNNLDKIDKNIMGGKQYAITSISVPYIENWLPKIPPIFEFIEKLTATGITPVPVVIGRDRNILTYQQTRLRGGPTWGNIMQMLNQMEEPPFYVSQELLYLYGSKYLKSLSKYLEFPIAYDDAIVEEILKEDANAKYIHNAGPTWLDIHVKSLSNPKRNS